MVTINVNLLQWFIIFLIKKTSGETVKNEYPKQLLENLIKEKYTLLLYRICRYAIDK